MEARQPVEQLTEKVPRHWGAGWDLLVCHGFLWFHSDQSASGRPANFYEILYFDVYIYSSWSVSHGKSRSVGQFQGSSSKWFGLWSCGVDSMGQCLEPLGVEDVSILQGGLEVGNMGRLRLGLRHAGRRMVLSSLVMLDGYGWIVKPGSHDLVTWCFGCFFPQKIQTKQQIASDAP